MTQPTQAVGGEPTAPAADANPATAFENLADSFFADEEQEENEQPAEETAEGDEPEALAEDDLELEAEDDDLPPIEAPVSWDAEAKAKFAELPRDLQETVKQREAEREKFVQQKSQEAARARSEVEQTAYQQLAQYDRQVSEQLSQLAAQIGPQRPDPAMLQYDPAGFYAQQAAYEGHAAQQRELQQQAAQYAEQAAQREQMAEQAYAQQEYQAIVEQFPEYADPTTGPKLRDELSGVAKYLGYPPELISAARATDILAMRKVAELKAKADKYDGLMSKKMEKVRAAKGLPRVATPGVAQGSAQMRQGQADAAWQQAVTAKTRNQRDNALATWAEKSGLL